MPSSSFLLILSPLQPLGEGELLSEPFVNDSRGCEIEDGIYFQFTHDPFLADTRCLELRSQRAVRAQGLSDLLGDGKALGKEGDVDSSTVWGRAAAYPIDVNHTKLRALDVVERDLIGQT